MNRIFGILLVFLFIGCDKNPNRIEEMTANNERNYVKKYFENNSKTKIELYDKKSNLLLTETYFKNEVITKLVEYYNNGKPKTVASLLKVPNFFGAKRYLLNGKKESEGSYLYNYKEQKLIPVSDWIFYNSQTQEADSIGRYFTDGKISVLEKVDSFDSKSKKKVTKRYFEIKPKDTLKDSIIWKSNEFGSFIRVLSYLK